MLHKASSKRLAKASCDCRNESDPWYGVQSSFVLRLRCMAVNHLALANLGPYLALPAASDGSRWMISTADR